MAHATRREVPESESAVGIAERELLSALMSDPSVIQGVREAGLSGADFQNPRLGVLASHLFELADEGRDVADLVGVVREAERRGRLESIGGSPFIADVRDYAGTSASANVRARQVRTFAIEREMTLLHERAAQGQRDDTTTRRLAALEAERTALDGATRQNVEGLGFTGMRLRALAERKDPESPLPALFDAYPALHVLVGRPKTAKTTFGLHLAQSWCCGVPPWTEAHALPGTRALVVSAEQSARRIVSTLRRLAQWHSEDPRDAWPERLVLFARDRDLTREAAGLFKLDPAGLALLRRMLQSAADAGDPFGLVLLDSLSRLKPAEAEENDADAMTAFLDPLAAIGADLGAYVVLIHHEGHAERANPVTAPRGSTSIAAVAQAVWKLEAPDGRPWERTVTVSGNAIESGSLTLRVSGEDAAGKVLFFRPVDPFAEMDLVPFAGLGVTAIAKRLHGERGKPSGSSLRRARDIEAELRRRGMHRRADVDD